MSRSLTPHDHQALSERIKAAEATTRGEIYCVVARSSDGYVFPAAFMLAVGVMLASLAVAVWLDRSWFMVGLNMIALTVKVRKMMDSTHVMPRSGSSTKLKTLCQNHRTAEIGQ